MITGNLYFDQIKVWDVYREKVIVPSMAKKLMKEQGTEAGNPLLAYVNHGRWLVKCECGGCEFAWDEGIFMCQSCLNAAHGHKYRIVQFPPQRKAIEQLLLRRRLPNRNWYPGETIADLADENNEHREELL